MSEIPKDLQKKAGEVVADLFPGDMMSMARVEQYAAPIAAALLAERERERARCAKIAYAQIEPTSFVHPARVDLNKANVMAKKIAAAIRQPDSHPTAKEDRR